MAFLQHLVDDLGHEAGIGCTLQVAGDMSGVAAPLHLGNHVEVAPFGQHHLRVAEQVEAAAGPRPGPPGALRDGAEFSVLARQQGQDAVGFAVLQPPQHHGIGLVGRHRSNSTDGS